MSRKRSRPDSPDKDAAALAAFSEADATMWRELTTGQRRWSTALSDPRVAQLCARVCVFICANWTPIMKALGYVEHFDAAPPPDGPGRPRDARLDRAASLYVEAVRYKDALRAMGFGGLTPDKDTMHEVAALCFPEARGDGAAKATERVKNAARKYRRRPSGN